MTTDNDQPQAAELHEREQGFAMLLVIALGFIFTGVALAVLNTTLNSQKSARHTQNNNGAVTAADAGIDDYLYRVNNNSAYVTYSTVTNTCSGGNVAANPDPANAAMRGWVNVPGAPVADLTTASQPQFRYDVDISQYCNSGKIILTSTGKLGSQTRTLRTTIKRKGFLDFIYFTDREDRDPALYTTNDFSGLSAPNNTATAQCARRYWDLAPTGSPRPDTGTPACQLIQFGGGDVINGPVHTNDRAIADNVTFNGPAFTSWGFTNVSGANPTASQHYSPGSNTPNFAYNKANDCTSQEVGAYLPTPAFANDFCVEGVLQMPPSNASLSAQTDSRLTNTPGCIFYGPTEITFNNNKMTVVSPYSTLNNASFPTNCTPGTNIPLPANGVIYVQDVPGTGSGFATSDANGPLCVQTDRAYGGLDPRGAPVMYQRLGNSVTTGTPGAFPAPSGVTIVPETRLRLSGATDNGAAANYMKYPQVNDASPPEFSFSSGETQAYPCTSGDAFVSGTLKGQVTLGTARNIFIVGDLKYSGGETSAGSNTDLLGLIANRYVEYYNPVDCDANGWLTASTTSVTYSNPSAGTKSYVKGACPIHKPSSGSTTYDNLPSTNHAVTDWDHLNIPTRGTSPLTDPQIDAAMLSTQHSVRTQNYEYGGQLGTLHIFGAIAQLYRGIVATQGSTGYVKAYTYDTRLKFASPPYFVTPVQAPFQVSNYAEESVPSAYR